MLEPPGLNISGVILAHARFRGTRTALGKVLKRELREPYWQEHS